MREEIVEWFKELQDTICKSLEEEDGKAKFHEDLWNRPGGGGGRTRVIQNGNVFEKGGVNYSGVAGTLPENIVKALGVSDADFFACGVSIVLHPKNPNVPIIHMNTRYFELSDGTYWFGGGIDLTPIYVKDEHAQYFHRQMKSVCDEADASFYEKFKQWADDYFFIKHRDETRGVGGIFFDRLNEGSCNLDKTEIFAFVKAVGASFAPTYRKIVAEQKGLLATDQQYEWQKIRRGRYVEFNLVYDKGTKFGLETAGRIESILMSLPTTAGWEYNYIPEDGSEEQKTIDKLKKGIDWV